MFRIITFLLIVLINPVLADNISPQDRQKLLDKVEQYNSAIREGDKKKYSDVFTDDFIFTWGRNGQIYNKKVILPNVVPTPDHKPIVDEVLMRQYGNSAVVNCRVRKSEKDTGTRVTFNYSKIKGEWKVITIQGTPIVAPESKEKK